MKQQNNSAFQKYKIKLALIFTSILVLTVFVFQASYTGIGAYSNFEISTKIINQAFQRIKQSNGKTGFGMSPGMGMGIGFRNNQNNDDGPDGGKGESREKGFSPRIQHIIFEKNSGSLYSTTMLGLSGQNMTFQNFSLKDLPDDKIKEISFNEDTNNVDYYFVYKNSYEYAGQEYMAYIFINNALPMSKVVEDLLLFGGFLILLGILVYYFIYKLIDLNLRRVEDSMKDMESFIHNAGHELKTPLTIASSSLQLALIDKKNTDYVKQAQESIKKMDGLIESLLDLSSIQRDLETEEVNVKECIEEALEYFQNDINNKDISISTNLSEKTVNANKQHLYILISNILNNAIKYNNQGGKINIILNKNKLEISDTGKGIPSDEIKKIFDRFYQVGGVRNQNGYGIGLSLVKKIGELYGRKVDVKSEIGQGTKFYITM